jgi:Co/Zn/Cd efflux system component
MSETCCATGAGKPVVEARFRRALWIALIVNSAMFVVESAGGVAADSVSLLADAVDFFGDAANYALSLLVLGWAARWRSRAAMAKGLTMGLYGIGVLGMAGLNAVTGSAPQVMTMGAIGGLALAVNVAVALLLYAHRNGDANTRSVWLCSRNDAIANVAVLLAALGVFGTGSAWPDLAVGAGIAVLALTAARSVVRQAAGELKAGPVALGEIR